MNAFCAGGGEPQHGRRRLHSRADRLAPRLKSSPSPSEGDTLPSRTEPWRTKPPNVLVVVADPKRRALLERGLVEQGFDPVWTAADRGAALRVAYSVRPDFILLDPDIESIDVPSVARGTKALSPATRVVVYSDSLTVPPGWADVLLKPRLDALFGFFRTKAS